MINNSRFSLLINLPSHILKSLLNLNRNILQILHILNILSNLHHLLNLIHKFLRISLPLLIHLHINIVNLLLHHPQQSPLHLKMLNIIIIILLLLISILLLLILQLAS